ncbi:hypothetical protein [Edaphobacter aggregans]|uniref:hypothetical protein n=1 Tax=Edaphobacter aggregans TaxID=570835 RepID=UPI0012FCBE06|nr:hypothetical protein [Edaphobacter aggregans]
MFYEIPENVGVRSLHGQFELNLQRGREQKYSANHIVIELKRAIEYSIKVGEVNGTRIEAVALAYDEESKKKGPVASGFQTNF